MEPSVAPHAISNAGLNSAMTWRHAPHGTAGVSAPAAIAIATNSRSPAATAAPMHTRSAHIVKPNEMFSTLTPVNTRPERVRRAAPTAKLEYGAYAARRAERAASKRSEISVFIQN